MKTKSFTAIIFFLFLLTIISFFTPQFINWLFPMKCSNLLYTTFKKTELLGFYSSFIAFLGTISLGILALWQNYRFKNENDISTAILQTAIAKLAKANVKLADTAAKANEISEQLITIEKNREQPYVEIDRESIVIFTSKKYQQYSEAYNKFEKRIRQKFIIKSEEEGGIYGYSILKAIFKIRNIGKSAVVSVLIESAEFSGIGSTINITKPLDDTLLFTSHDKYIELDFTKFSSTETYNDNHPYNKENKQIIEKIADGSPIFHIDFTILYENLFKQKYRQKINITFIFDNIDSSSYSDLLKGNNNTYIDYIRFEEISS